jgi:putative methionine-R-sulfoxide reductase with GAF domain
MKDRLARDFSAWLQLVLRQWPGGIPAEREAEYARMIRGTADLLRQGESFWHKLPALIADVFGGRGWRWNGVYVRRGDELHLAEGAAGPPVCSPLKREEGGGVGSSGSCWDAILMNQTIALEDVSQWPGYVSCDQTSNLKTASGMICPIRDGAGRPIAVWDLDSEQKLAPQDPIFMGHFFDTLSVCLKPGEADLVSIKHGRNGRNGSSQRTAE